MITPNKFIVERAKASDAGQILSIIEDIDFNGKISLLFTRRPDPITSFRHEGEQVDTIVCREKEKGKVVGFGNCSVNTVYINGGPVKIGYLFGLRISRAYRRVAKVIHKGYEFFHRMYKDKGISLFILSILKENTHAKSLLERPRKSIPLHKVISHYRLFTIPTGKGKTNPRFRKATKSDVPSIVQFLNKHGKKHNLFPVINELDIIDEKYKGVTYDRFCIMRDEQGEVLATGCLWDQSSYKQYVIKRYSGIYKLLNVCPSLFTLFGYPKLPREGGLMRFFTLSFWQVKDDDPTVFKSFIDNVRLAERRYNYFIVGTTEQNPLMEVLEGYKSVSLDSLIYSVIWDDMPDLYPSNRLNRLDYLECGLL